MLTVENVPFISSAWPLMFGHVVSLFVCLSIWLAVRLSVCPSIYLAAVWQCVSLYVCLFLCVCPSISQSMWWTAIYELVICASIKHLVRNNVGCGQCIKNEVSLLLGLLWNARVITDGTDIGLSFYSVTNRQVGHYSACSVYKSEN